MVDDMVTTEWISDIWWNCSKVMKYVEPWWWHVRCVQAIIKSISSTWHAKSNKKKHTNKGGGRWELRCSGANDWSLCKCKGQKGPFDILQKYWFVCVLTTIIYKTQLGKLLKTHQEIISLCSLCMLYLMTTILTMYALGKRCQFGSYACYSATYFLDIVCCVEVEICWVWTFGTVQLLKSCVDNLGSTTTMNSIPSTPCIESVKFLNWKNQKRKWKRQPGSGPKHNKDSSR
jgi:hypothetical protein